MQQKTEWTPQKNVELNHELAGKLAKATEAVEKINKAAMAMPHLPPNRQKTVEAAALHFQEICDERDKYAASLADAQNEITRQKVEIESLNSLHNLLESRLESAIVAKDAAVEEMAKAYAERKIYVKFCESLQAQLKTFLADEPANG